jgi:hypothetical protein
MSPLTSCVVFKAFGDQHGRAVKKRERLPPLVFEANRVLRVNHPTASMPSSPRSSSSISPSIW